MGRAVQPHAHYKPWLKLTAELSPDKPPITTSLTTTLDPIPSLAGSSGWSHEPPRPPTAARASATQGFRECVPVRVVSVLLRGCAESMRRTRLNGRPSQGPRHPRCLHRRCRAGRCSTIWQLALSGTVVWLESPATPPHRFRAATVPCLCLSRACLSPLAAPDHCRMLLACSPAIANSAGVGSTHPLEAWRPAPTHTQPSVATVTPSSPCLCLPPHNALSCSAEHHPHGLHTQRAVVLRGL
jgi:hypothetical protein